MSPVLEPRMRWAHAWRIVGGLLGVALGGIFLWLALLDVTQQELRAVVSQMRISWLLLAIAIYLSSIGLRSFRWAILLHTNATAKWRHVAEALLTGYAANFLLPARLGELVRADYAARLLGRSRLTVLGTILIERVCDGIVIVCMLWLCLGLVLSSGTIPTADVKWIAALAAISSLLFCAALGVIFLFRRFDIRRFHTPKFIIAGWDRLAAGIAAVTLQNRAAIAVCSIAIWLCELVALLSVCRAFSASLAFSQAAVVLGVSSLSTLVPTAPGYLGTYQFVFSRLFALFGLPASIGFIIATAIQIFFFGTVTLMGLLGILSRTGLTALRRIRLSTTS